LFFFYFQKLRVERKMSSDAALARLEGVCSRLEALEVRLSSSSGAGAPARWARRPHARETRALVRTFSKTFEEVRVGLALPSLRAGHAAALLASARRVFSAVSPHMRGTVPRAAHGCGGWLPMRRLLAVHVTVLGCGTRR